jgi:hypothetical protein
MQTLFSSKPHGTFFSNITPLEEVDKLFEEPDFLAFVSASSAWIKSNNVDLFEQWITFTQYLKQEDCKQSEKFILLQAAFKAAIKNPVKPKELSQLLTLTRHLKEVYGTNLFHSVLTHLNDATSIGNYITLCQLLLDLQEVNDIFTVVKKTLPDTAQLIKELRKIQTKYLADKYPDRPIHEVIARFKQKDELTQFPLPAGEVEEIGAEYESIKLALADLKEIPQSNLTEMAATPKSNHQLIAIIVETARRVFNISPYDTQIFVFLALIKKKQHLKGRIGQIKTGEGKSLIRDLIAAYEALQKNSVHIITSSSFLAKEGYETSKPFFQALGLTSAHICDKNAIPEQFKADVIYGENTDFEFAWLRNGLYNLGLNNQPFDTVIVDEADNFFIDLARSAAIIAIPGDEDIHWVYRPILEFVKNEKNKNCPEEKLITELRQFLLQEGQNYRDKIAQFSERRLIQWLKSAKDAWYHKKENQDYVVKVPEKKPHDDIGELDIVIVDAENTGRFNEGCHWQHGLHQFLQVKHNLKVTPESRTVASIPHPCNFNLYKHIIAVTGTNGEKERDEMQQIYKIDNFDAPSHLPSQRQRYADEIWPDEESQNKAILKEIKTMQQQDKPVLVLFKTIGESNRFKIFLEQNGLKPQLLNETQKEAENYVIARAGDPARITIATNTAGRGTDIKLAPQSKAAGGLHTIFTFYPNNTRVEDQGFGRSGRQGEPGSGRMILNESAENINFILSNEEKRQLSSQDKFLLLDQFRRARGKIESEQRCQSSERQALLFDKLQDFFNRLEKLNTLFRNQEFKKTLIDYCSSQTTNSDSSDHNNAFNLNDEANLTDIKASAKILLAKQSQGIEIDWSYFYNQFRDTYFSRIRRIWALFYTQIHDEINEGDISSIKEKIELAHAEVQLELDQYLLHPEKNSLGFLQEIFNQVHQEVIGAQAYCRR